MPSSSVHLSVRPSVCVNAYRPPMPCSIEPIIYCRCDSITLKEKPAKRVLGVWSEWRQNKTAKVKMATERMKILRSLGVYSADAEIAQHKRRGPLEQARCKLHCGSKNRSTMIFSFFFYIIITPAVLYRGPECYNNRVCLSVKMFAGIFQELYIRISAHFCQGTLPWQRNNVGSNEKVMKADWHHVHSLHVCQVAAQLFCYNLLRRDRHYGALRAIR